jgi:Zn-dependent metalloprotease
MKAFILRLAATSVLAARGSFISGRSLGVVKVENLPQIALNEEEAGAEDNAKAAATEALLRILQEHLAYAGDELLIPTRHRARAGCDGRTHHFRFKQHLQGRPIEGASIVMHVRENGTVYGISGEIHPSSTIDPLAINLDCRTATELARQEEHGLAAYVWEWDGDCEEAAVQGRDGKAHYAFKRSLRYSQMDGSRGLDVLFASPSDGMLLAVHPQLYRIRSLSTLNCLTVTSKLDQCSLISNSSDKIVTPDAAAQDAHNNVLDVYDFYKTRFARFSMDGYDGHINIIVGIDDVESAFINPSSLIFGNGDGKTTIGFTVKLAIIGDTHSLTTILQDIPGPTIQKDLMLVSYEVFHRPFGRVTLTFPSLTT